MTLRQIFHFSKILMPKDEEGKAVDFLHYMVQCVFGYEVRVIVYEYSSDYVLVVMKIVATPNNTTCNEDTATVGEPEENNRAAL